MISMPPAGAALALLGATMRRWWAVIPLLVLSASGCFYLDPINTRPLAKISDLTGKLPDPLHKEDLVQLSATGSTDAEGDDVTFLWRASTCPTPATCTLVATGNEPSFSFRIPTHDDVHVDLSVTDSHGASGIDTLDIAVVDRPPVVMLQPIVVTNADGTITLGREIHFVGAIADPDGDAPNLTFVLLPPPQSIPAAVQFTVETDHSRVLIPDVPGSWTVQLLADDGFGGTDMASQTVFVVDDRPPCLGVTTPAWVAGAHVLVTAARSFEVDSVLDDLDPYPVSAATTDPDLGGAHFRWFVGKDGGPLDEITGHDLASLAIDPAAWTPGDVLDVRVEISDRVSRTLPCAADQALCSIAGDTCYQRLTWLAEVR
jgi:hypothetical protein